MSRKFTLDTSVPKYDGIATLSLFDTKVFTKTLDILAVRAPASKVSTILKSPEMREYLLDLRKIASVATDTTDPTASRLVLLRASNEADLPEDVQSFLKTQAESKGFVPYKLTLDYDYWTADEIIRAVMPDHLKDGAPSGFAATGHIAHLNLNSDYVPYRNIIGKIILDKNKKTIKTVVNKLDTIDTVFRFFKMDLIAGEPNFLVEHSESDCVFTFDFREVYWNSRLHTEHARLVDMFSPEDVVADVFAGVGPFAVPAAKKGCAVLANDLNPNSVKYLQENVGRNKVRKYVRVFCQDGRDFIRRAFRDAFEQPLQPAPSPRLSKSEARRLMKSGQYQPMEPVGKPPRQKISHFVMNLPDTAITFLDAFRGVLASDRDHGIRELYDVMPMIHCHCFTRELDPKMAEADIRQRVEEKIGASLSGDIQTHWVRSVAPNKEMYCISFRLPPEVAFASSA
ncbi:hypothetical protein H0H92_013095 [Tricholoma furcatifolium]|nr:hypothetical protein H0H92_013095 [Tricholoma furcatifolium]